MSRIGICLIKDSEAFGSFPKRMALEIILQNIVWRQPFPFHILIIKFVSALRDLYVAVSLAHEVLTIELLCIVVTVNKENVAQLFWLLTRNKIAHLNIVAMTAQRLNLLDVGIKRMYETEY